MFIASSKLLVLLIGEAFLMLQTEADTELAKVYIMNYLIYLCAKMK